MSKFVSLLYQLARTANDISKLSSVKKIAVRGKNKLVGRIIGPKIYGGGGRKKWR